MVTELLGIGACGFGLYQFLTSENREIKRKWKYTVYNAGVKNSVDETFEILKIIYKHYGYDVIISIPQGKSFDDLVKILPAIESSFGATVTLEWKKDKHCIYGRIVKKEFDITTEFTPVKVKPYEAFCGFTAYHKKIIADLRTSPHLLVSGAVGTGKSRYIYALLSNFVYYCPNDIQLYLAQISDKHDLKMFRKIKQTKCYVETLAETRAMLQHLKNVKIQRNKVIDKYIEEGVYNIGDYNKKFPKKKWKYLYVFADEFSFYMEDKKDTQQQAKDKSDCNSLMRELIVEGRSVGIFLILCTQRPDKESIPPIFKSQMCTRFCLAQNNTASSLVVVDDGEAVTLGKQEAIVIVRNERYKVIVPYIDEPIIKKYLSQYFEPEHQLMTLSIKQDKKNTNKPNDEKRKENNNTTTIPAINSKGVIELS